MTWALHTVEGALALLVLAVGFTLALLLWRRWAISRECPVLPCALQQQAQSQWRLGLLRLSVDSLDWFSLVGFSVRPANSWRRRSIELQSTHPLTGESIPGIATPVEVEIEVAGQRIVFAMDQASYPAVRSWAESLPPGHNTSSVF